MLKNKIVVGSCLATLIFTSNVGPAKAISVGSIYPFMCPINPPASPTKNAETMIIKL